MSVGRDLDPPVRWVRYRWDEANGAGRPAEGLDGSWIDFLYELDEDGYVLRSIELMGPAEVPIAAASLAEFWSLQGYRQQSATPALLEHQRRYGDVPDKSWPDSEGPFEEITHDEFESAWIESRAHLSEVPRSAHFAPRQMNERHSRPGGV